MNHLTTAPNAHAIPLASVPVMDVEDFRETVISSVESGWRISSFFAYPRPTGLVLLASLANDQSGLLGLASAPVGDSYQALTGDCPQAHWFEREVFEQWGLRPVGHPWLKPIRFQPPCRPGEPGSPQARIGITDFYRIEGDEIHEVAVGPVHAGVIEPGHFRFQCRGEAVEHLEISLGYQHRGVERALVGGPDKRTIHTMETLAGDTTVAHAWAYCQALEALGQSGVSTRAQALRGVAAELERLANHIGDLGALANDVGFLPTAAYCGRIRGDALNLTALVCGSRFGRGMVRPGGVGFDLDPALVESALERLTALARDTAVAVNLLWDSPSVLARFEGAGTLTGQQARDIGLVGPPARACGLERDVRQCHPYGIYRFAHIPLAVCDTGDVFARAHVRWLEIQRSIVFINDQLRSLPQDPLLTPPAPPAPDRIAVSLVEGWRGEICHVALTGPDGRLAAYKVVDPSFHNWFGLALAMRNEPISDFPLCNKSFNLSYCGHDL